MTAPTEIDIGTLIERKPGVYGGRPVLKGTRFPVTLIGILLQDGWSPERIHDEYLSDLDITLVYAGITFYLANKAAIDVQIEEDARLYEEMAAQHPAGADRKNAPSS